MSTVPKCWAVIPAAGIGERVGSSLPKQYLKIAGKTILEHAISPFIKNSCIAGITIALNQQDVHFDELNIKTRSQKIHTVIGGATRAHSVLNALNSFEAQLDKDDFVLVHDAARPCLTMSDLEKLIGVCIQHDVGGIVGSPMPDTIKQVEKGNIENTLDRENIWRAYTPQMFKFEVLRSAILKAFADNVRITDEANALEYVGYKPCMVEGDSQNLKITTAEDVSIAEMILQKRK
ncbi:MAG: 2-C-methyl-D-erythritol 4-phosphate cytidylyltransferase [Gammaproteobacteria bacterium]|nr:2-C-methyl-D-erythritol 4-phosphate cytidylyltransferase [Gammaproteobacteria bacterium]